MLFPAGGEKGSLDAVRIGLRGLGLGDDEIERDFLPAIALRNEVDVAHVQLGLLTADELSVVHDYAERAELAFRRMLEAMLNAVESGMFEVLPYEVGPAGARTKRVVERIRRNASATPA